MWENILRSLYKPSEKKRETIQYRNSRIWELNNQKARLKIRPLRYFICEIFGKMFYPDL